MSEITVFDESAGITPEEDQPLIQVKTFKEWHALSKEQQQRLVANNSYRRRMVFVLRANGLEFPQIASELKISAGTAVNDHRIYNAKLKQLGIIEPDAERSAQIHRLDTLMMTYFQRAIDGDTEAAAIYLGLENRRTKLLGLDQPLKMNINHKHRRAPELSKEEREKALYELTFRLERNGKLNDDLRAWRGIYEKTHPPVIEGEVVRSQAQVGDSNSDKK